MAHYPDSVPCASRHAASGFAATFAASLRQGFHNRAATFFYRVWPYDAGFSVALMVSGAFLFLPIPHSTPMSGNGGPAEDGNAGIERAGDDAAKAHQEALLAAMKKTSLEAPAYPVSLGAFFDLQRPISLKKRRTKSIAFVGDLRAAHLDPTSKLYRAHYPVLGGAAENEVTLARVMEELVNNPRHQGIRSSISSVLSQDGKPFNWHGNLDPFFKQLKIQAFIAANNGFNPNNAWHQFLNLVSEHQNALANPAVPHEPKKPDHPTETPAGPDHAEPVETEGGPHGSAGGTLEGGGPFGSTGGGPGSHPGVGPTSGGRARLLHAWKDWSPEAKARAVAMNAREVEAAGRVEGRPGRGAALAGQGRSHYDIIRDALRHQLVDGKNIYQHLGSRFNDKGHVVNLLDHSYGFLSDLKNSGVLDKISKPGSKNFHDFVDLLEGASDEHHDFLQAQRAALDSTRQADQADLEKSAGRFKPDVLAQRKADVQEQYQAGLDALHETANAAFYDRFLDTVHQGLVSVGRYPGSQVMPALEKFRTGTGFSSAPLFRTIGEVKNAQGIEHGSRVQRAIAFAHLVDLMRTGVSKPERRAVFGDLFSHALKAHRLTLAQIKKPLPSGRSSGPRPPSVMAAASRPRREVPAAPSRPAEGRPLFNRRSA